MVTAKEVMDCMSKYIEASKSERDARANYTGYSWGYHGYEYNKTKEEAEAKCEAALDQYVKAAVHEALVKAGVLEG